MLGHTMIDVRYDIELSPDGFHAIARGIQGEGQRDERMSG